MISVMKEKLCALRLKLHTILCLKKFKMICTNRIMDVDNTEKEVKCEAG